MVSFNNSQTAYTDKNNKYLLRAYFLFRTINSPFVVKILKFLIRLAIKLHIPIEGVIKNTVYKHFCGGTSIKNCELTINNLAKSNIGTILDYSAEGKESEAGFNKCTDQIIESIRYAKENQHIPFAVFKLTLVAKQTETHFIKN